MPRSRRRAFSLVEVLCALTLIGVGAAVFAAALTDDRALRSRAALRSDLAAALRGRLELVATRSCTAGDTAGAVPLASGVERWHARMIGGAWALDDSIVPPVGPGLSTSGRVTCPG